MPGKTDIYNLGEKGVNRVKSPVHLADGELTTAQNAQIIPYNAQKALAKRRGMTLLNVTTAAAGAILNFFRVSLVDPAPTDVDPTPSTASLLFYIPYSVSFSTFHKFPPDTPDLTSASWIDITEEFRNPGYPSEQNRIFRLPSTGSVVWYPSIANGRTWEQYDATTDSTASAFSLPATGPNGSSVGSITSYCTDGSNIYVSVLYGGTGTPTAVYKCTQAGVVTQVGEWFRVSGTGAGSIRDDYAGGSTCWWNGRLWTVGVNTNDYATFEATVYSIDPATESAWTLDYHDADVTDEYGNFYPTVGNGGDVLVGCWFSFNISPLKHQIWTRTTGGTWAKRIKENVATNSNYTLNTMRCVYGTGSVVFLRDAYRLLHSADGLITNTQVGTYSTWTYHTDVVPIATKLYLGTWTLASPWRYGVTEVTTAGGATEITTKSVSTSLRSFLLGEV